MIGVTFGISIGITLLSMFGVQLYRISTDISAEQMLFKQKRLGYSKPVLHEYNNWEAVFGKNKWTWLIPTRPHNEQYDPHFVGSEEIMLPDYEELTTND